MKVSISFSGDFTDADDLEKGLDQIERVMRGCAGMLRSNNLPAAPVTEAPAAPVTEAPAAPVTEAPAAPVTEAPAAPVTEAPAAPVTEAPAEPVIDECYRVMVRKKLRMLNAKIAGNPASALIRQITGESRLTEVPPEKLPALMTAAEEALNNAG